MTNLEIVKKLIGEIKPVGSTHIDSQRLENLVEMCNLVNSLITEIDEAGAFRHRTEFSMKQIGEYAYNFLTKDIGIV